MTSRQLLLFSDNSDSASYDVTLLAAPVEQSVTTQEQDPAVNNQSLTKMCAKPRPADKPIRKKVNKPRKQQQTVSAMSVVLRVGEVALRYSASIPTIWRWVKEKNGFPAPVHIGPGTTRWYIADLDAFDAQRRTAAAKVASK